MNIWSIDDALSNFLPVKFIRDRDQCVSTSNKKNIYIVITWNLSHYHLPVNCSKFIITWHDTRFSKGPVTFRAPKAMLSVCMPKLWVNEAKTERFVS